MDVAQSAEHPKASKLCTCSPREGTPTYASISTMALRDAPAAIAALQTTMKLTVISVSATWVQIAMRPLECAHCHGKNAM